MLCNFALEKIWFTIFNGSRGDIGYLPPQDALLIKNNLPFLNHMIGLSKVDAAKLARLFLSTWVAKLAPMSWEERYQVLKSYLGDAEAEFKGETIVATKEFFRLQNDKVAIYFMAGDEACDIRLQRSKKYR